jgi:hypothetical protein
MISRFDCWIRRRSRGRFESNARLSLKANTKPSRMILAGRMMRITMHLIRCTNGWGGRWRRRGHLRSTMGTFPAYPKPPSLARRAMRVAKHVSRRFRRGGRTRRVWNRRLCRDRSRMVCRGMGWPMDARTVLYTDAVNPLKANSFTDLVTIDGPINYNIV